MIIKIRNFKEKHLEYNSRKSIASAFLSNCIPILAAITRALRLALFSTLLRFSTQRVLSSALILTPSPNKVGDLPSLGLVPAPSSPLTALLTPLPSPALLSNLQTIASISSTPHPNTFPIVTKLAEE